MPAKTIEIDFENFKEENLTREEASEYLGVKKSFLEVNATYKRHKIPYYKVGKTTRYLKKDLDIWVQETKVGV